MAKRKPDIWTVKGRTKPSVPGSTKVTQQGTNVVRSRSGTLPSGAKYRSVRSEFHGHNSEAHVPGGKVFKARGSFDGRTNKVTSEKPNRGKLTVKKMKKAK